MLALFYLKFSNYKLGIIIEDIFKLFVLATYVCYWEQKSNGNQNIFISRTYWFLIIRLSLQMRFLVYEKSPIDKDRFVEQRVVYIPYFRFWFCIRLNETRKSTNISTDCDFLITGTKEKYENQGDFLIWGFAVQIINQIQKRISPFIFRFNFNVIKSIIDNWKYAQLIRMKWLWICGPILVP